MYMRGKTNDMIGWGKDDRDRRNGIGGNMIGGKMKGIGGKGIGGKHEWLERDGLREKGWSGDERLEQDT